MRPRSAKSTGLTRWWSKPASLERRGRSVLAVAGQGHQERLPSGRRAAEPRRPPRSRPCPGGRCRAAPARAIARPPPPAPPGRRGRRVTSWPASTQSSRPSVRAASTLSSTTRTRSRLARGARRSRAATFRRRRGRRRRAAAARRTRCRGPGPRCAPRPCRRASRPASAPGSGRCPARPARGRATGSPARTGRRRCPSSSAAHADPVVAHRDDRLAALTTRRVSAMWPPGVGVLGGVVEQVGERPGRAASGRRPAAAARSRARWPAACRCSTMAAGSTSTACGQDASPGRPAPVCSWILPWLMRDTSSRSSTSRVMCCTWRAITALVRGSELARLRARAGRGPGRRCGWGPAGCAARGPASPGTRPCGGRPPAASCSARAALGDVLTGAEHAPRLARWRRSRNRLQEWSTRTVPSGRTIRYSFSNGSPRSMRALASAGEHRSRSSGWMAPKNDAAVELDASRARSRRSDRSRSTSAAFRVPAAVLGQAHLPAADVRGRLRLLEHVLAPAQRRLGGPDLGDVVDQGDQTAHRPPASKWGRRSRARRGTARLVGQLVLEGHLLAARRRARRRAGRLPPGRAEHLARVAPADRFGRVPNQRR